MSQYNTSQDIFKPDNINTPLLAGDSISNNGGLDQNKSKMVIDQDVTLRVRSSIKSKKVPIDQSKVVDTTAPEQLDHSVDISKITFTQEEVIENNTDKSIDFNAQLNHLKKRTECELPHTLSQVEDAMYLDQYHIMTLEYHYYQNECKYHNMLQCDEQLNEEGVFVDSSGNKVQHLLATEKYQDDPNNIHPMSAFERNNIINYVEDHEDILRAQRQLEKSDMMKVGNDYIPLERTQSRIHSKLQQKTAQVAARKKVRDDTRMVEAILALYKITPLGGMQRSNQVDVKMGRKFFQSKTGNMILTRSKDKKIISLTNFDCNDPDGEYFKTLAWTNKLRVFSTADNFELLNNGMNYYYREHEDTFDELVEVSFVGNSKFVQLIYIEARQRSLVEQQQYEQQIQGQCAEKKEAFDTFSKRQTPRKARKYVFFDACSGEIIFEYGGVKQPITAINSSGQEIEVFELGLLVKEIREEAFNPQICVFFCGDFMDPAIKENQVMLKWAMNTVFISMRQIFEFKTNDEKVEFVSQKIREVIAKNQNDGYLNYYPFDSSWIEAQRFNWEQCIVPSSNRKFNEYALINTPADTTQDLQSTYYVNGPKYKELLKVSSLKLNNYILDPAYYIKLPFDAVCRHTRNANIKDYLFYDVIKNNEVKTYCLRLDHPEDKYKVIVVRIPISNIVSQNDIWLHFRRNQVTNMIEEIFQTVNVTKGDQTAILKTKLPKSMKNINSSDVDDIVERKTNMFYQVQADLPCICYNLGDSKIVLQNILQLDNKRKYIVNLMPDEKFVCFVQFNQFEDIGFYPNGLRVECCSHFAFLTAGKGEFSGNITKNRINLLLIDPFYEDTQITHFKSSVFFDNEIFTESDTIVQSIIQSTMGKKRDLKFKTYIWTQFPQNLVRSSLMRQKNNQLQMAEDSDKEDVSDIEDDEDVTGKLSFEQVRLVMNERDYIYYITKKNGKCYIMEGNPRDQYIDKHEAIYQIKAQKCLAFSVEGQDTFYFMDECHVVYKLTRNQNNRMLNYEKELTMKEIQRLDFNPNPFDYIIMNEKYAVQGSKIFYLYDLSNEPFPEGIFEAEELIEDSKTKSKYLFSNGPITVKSSNRFFNVYQIDKFQSNIRIFLKPDKTQKKLINDYLNWVDMSTFLEDGKILVKIRRRFMIFTSDGAFIDEVEFNDDLLKNINEKNEDEPNMTFKKFKENMAATRIDEGPSNIAKLQRRRMKNPILDFLGHQYEFRPSQPQVPLSFNNRMELFNMSYNNRYFLFYNRMAETICVYEIQESTVIQKQETFYETPTPPKKVIYQFVLKYNLNFDKSHLFQYFYTINIDPIEYYRNNLSQIKMDDNGGVKLCYIENLPYINKEEVSGISETFSDDVIQCRLVGSLFTPVEGQFNMKIQNFTQIFDFPRDAHIRLASIIDSKKTDLDRKINNIRSVQARLPKKLFDYSQYENMIEELIILEGKPTDHVYAKVYYDNLVIIYCGQYVKFGKLILNKKRKQSQNKQTMELVLQKNENGKILTDMNAYFSNGVEVIKVIETAKKNWLQIMTKDHEQDIFTIVTWDFDNNMEQSILQMCPKEDENVGQHVIKGMNLKFNYYLSQNYLTDLEYNIPLRQTNVDQDLNIQCSSYNKQLQMINDFFNQRKVYKDNSKFLGVEKACCLYYPLSRMDILLWQNINVLGEKPELIQQTCTLQQCNLVIDGTTLFHYFADNSNLIEQIHMRYIDLKQNDLLKGTDSTLPLQILNPDNQGHTALYLATATQSPQSFECMVDMLCDFPEICLSKMMLKSLALIVSNENSQVINFFELNIFTPPQMQIQQFIPWGDDMEEFIFASHTSIISKQLLIEKLVEEGVIEESKPKKKKNFMFDPEEPEQISKYQKCVDKSALRQMILMEKFDSGLSEGEQPLRRVQIEALDLDWIFTEDNAKILLNVLATEANNSVLTKKSIRVFVDLMWTKYQTAIIKFIFVPYMAYLFVLSQLSGQVVGEFINILYKDISEPEIWQSYTILKIKAYVLTAISTSLMICFGSLEVKQMLVNGLEYFSDYWNCIDATSLSINAVYLGMATTCIIFENEYFDVQLIRTFGAFACFFMWIKVFYWMRLFSALAYYVKLIQQTISDSLYFMLMVFLIILSFANFFYVIDRNIKGTVDGRYYDQYTSVGDVDNSIIDVIISVYMMGALGDFDSARYRVGYDRYFAMAMFLLATFIICVVFMNMLIAIMGETFGQVQEVSHESGLREQVVLIADHAWLLDLKKIFKGQKYIIRVQPSTSTQEQEDAVLDKVKDSEQSLAKKLMRLQHFIQKRVDSVDNNTSFLLKYQQISIESVTRRIKNLEKVFKQAMEQATDDEFSKLNEDQKQLVQDTKKRKAEILNMLNAQTSGQTLTVEKVQEIALSWMDLADKDGNGELDFGEFYDFFSKIEGIVVSEDEIRQIFNDFDGTGNGCLSVEEFARAIYQAVLADQDEYSEEEYGLEQQDQDMEQIQSKLGSDQ